MIKNTKKMDNKSIFDKNFAIAAIIILVLVFGSMILFKESILSPNFPNKFSGESESIKPILMSFPSFSSCLSYVNATFYGFDWCPHCQTQKEILGEDYLKIYVECSGNEEFCYNQGVSSIPDWRIKGKQYLGVQSLEKLSKLTGCPWK